MRIAALARRSQVKIQKSLTSRGVLGTAVWGMTYVMRLPRIRAQRKSQEADLTGRVFDAQYGVDTSGKIELLSLDIASENMVYGTAYQASDATECRICLSRLSITPEEATFVDLGSGKGRVLMIASQLGYKRIVGVEFSTELSEISRNNLRSLKKEKPAYPSWEIVCGDASEYPIPDEPLVLYMANPFDEEVMSKVIWNVKTSLHRRPRNVYIVYMNAVHGALWENDDQFRLQHKDAYCSIFSTRLS